MKNVCRIYACESDFNEEFDQILRKSCIKDFHASNVSGSSSTSESGSGSRGSESGSSSSISGSSSSSETRADTKKLLDIEVLNEQDSKNMTNEDSGQKSKNQKNKDEKGVKKKKKKNETKDKSKKKNDKKTKPKDKGKEENKKKKKKNKETDTEGNIKQKVLKVTIVKQIYYSQYDWTDPRCCHRQYTFL